MLPSHKTVMISGHFDIFTDAHLDYLEQAAQWGDYLICVVSSDRQVLLKKGKVNMPEYSRARIVDLILKGLGLPHEIVVNHYDRDTTLVAEALRAIKPDIFCRGGDKTLETMPTDERKACEELGIEIVHAKYRLPTHGSTMT